MDVFKQKKNMLPIWQMGLYGIAAFFIMVLFFRYSGVNYLPGIKFEEMVYGTAAKPFVTRTFVPAAIRSFTSITPQKEFVQKYLSDNSPIQKFFRWTGWAYNVDPKKYSLESLYGIIILFTLLYGFIIGTRGLYLSCFPNKHRLLIFLIPLLALFGLVFFFDFGYIYDFASLFCGAWLILCMARKKWVQYFLIFIVASMNKETSVLFAMIFFLFFWKNREIKTKNKALFFFAQIVIYAAIRLGLEWAFQDNLGTHARLVIEDNIKYLYVYKEKMFFIAAVLSFLVLFQWKRKPKILRCAAAMAIPLVILTALYGCFNEWRVLYEIYTVLALLCFESLDQIFRINQHLNKFFYAETIHHLKDR